MKLFSSELGHNYETYTFGYANYLLREPGDSLSSIYGTGYLPYSGSGDAKNIFYMARSARVVLKDFELLSENRRIAKKFDGRFKKERVQFNKFKIDKDFYAFCLEYFKTRHGNVMPRERFKFILESSLISNTLIYHSENKPVTYVLEVEEKEMGHYWYSFFDVTLAKQSFGLWLMQDAILDAKNRGLSHYYLGTVYGEKALYKTNFKPLQWWDGDVWNTDIALLKKHSRNDNARIVGQVDEWKKNQPLF